MRPWRYRRAMARPLRIEFGGALYHVTSRGDRRHRVTGHLFQGRYKAIPIEEERHLPEPSRYVALNPAHSSLVSRSLAVR